MNAREKESLLSAIHMLRNGATSKKLKDEELKQSYAKELEKIGIDLQSRDPNTESILRDAKNAFDKKYSEAHEKESPEESPEGEKQKETVNQKVKEKVKEKEPEQPEEEEDEEEEDEEEESKDSEEPQSQKKKLSNVDPADAVKEIKKDKEEIISYIQKQIDSTEDKNKAKKLDKIQKNIQNTLSKLEKKASYGPKNARDALNKANTETLYAKNEARRATLMGVGERTVKGAKESMQTLKKGVSGAVKGAQEKIRKSENLAKAKDVASKVKENIKGAASKTGEAIKSKAKDVSLETNYRLIKSQLGDAQASKYLNDPEKNGDLIEKAKKEKIKKGETLRGRIDKIKQKTKKSMPTMPEELRKKLLPKRRPVDSGVTSTRVG
jgi:hypothetical protein